MNPWIDVTRPLDDTLVCWPGRVPPAHTWERRIEQGAHCNASQWRMSAHAGTHLDAPLHFCAQGKSIDEIPPDVFMGDCAVIDLSPRDRPRMDDALARHYVGEKKLLFRTHHSEPSPTGAYEPHEALLTPGAADLLTEGGLALVGTDRLSVDGTQGKDFAVHRLLLGAGCVILEGLMLAGVAPGRYVLHAAPLSLTGAEASPVRALLRRQDLP